MDPLAGKTVDKYTLVRMLGEGGMGAVYEAKHSLIGKRVAVKLLHADMANEGEATQRMLREAQAAAAIGHPNIIQTHDYGVTPDGMHYLVMDLLIGESFAELLEREGALPVHTTITIVAQTLDALQAAHDVGIVHRDLKPDNIYVSEHPEGGETIKLLDFGISKFNPLGGEQLRLTRTGAVMGTPYYMSPEQASGARVDQRTDLWSVGVILYEALTGQMPFPGENYNQVMAKILMRHPTPVNELRADVPPELGNVINKALAKDQNERYESAHELMHDLVKFDKAAVVHGPFSLKDSLAGATRVEVAPAGEGEQVVTLSGAQTTGMGNTTMSPGEVMGASAAPASGGKKFLLIGGAVAAAVIAVVAVLVLGGGDKKQPPAKKPAVAAAPDAGAKSDEPEQLSISLPGLPEGAKLQLDGKSVTAPIKIAADGQKHELAVKAEGYKDWKTSFKATPGLTEVPILMTSTTTGADLVPIASNTEGDKKSGTTRRRTRRRVREPASPMVVVAKKREKAHKPRPRARPRPRPMRRRASDDLAD